VSLALTSDGVILDMYILLTAETNLTACCQNCFQHFTNFNVTENAPYVTTQAIFYDGHDLEKDDFVPRRVTGLKFAVRNRATEFDKGLLQRD
jgi:hypothetical protein